MADSYLCRKCSKVVTATKNGRYRTHFDKTGERCEMASAEIPPDLLEQGPVDPKAPKDVPVEGQDFATCPTCDRKVKLTSNGYFPPHNPTLYGGERCPKSGTRLHYPGPNRAGKLLLKPLEDVPLPGDELPEKGVYMQQSATVTDTVLGEELVAGQVVTKEVLETARKMLEPGRVITAGLKPPASTFEELVIRELSATPVAAFLQPAPVAESGASTETNSPESPTTSTPSPEPVNGRFRQPGSPFLQPPAYEGPVKAEPMGDLAKELATRIKETFYSYSNRKSTDNRSAQTTLGPSEIGTPCDRRLAMSLLGIAPVNPGGDGWAAFVGTCTHVGMAEVYTFADAGTGRYAVELPVHLGMPSVPRGTTDLLDRRDGLVVDWKVMGSYSLKKFKSEGPSATYRTQAHVYGLGAERGGEVVRNVAIVGLPRAGSSLDEMHVWTEKFDRKFAQSALDRVEKIAGEASSFEQHGTPMEIARKFEPADDCRYCPFHLKNDKGMERGCPGK